MKVVSDLARGLTVNLAGKFIGRGLHIIGQILLARWLGPAMFGLYAIGWNVVRLFSLVLPLGMDVGLLEQGGGLWPEQRDRAGKLAITGLWLTFIVSSVACVVLMVGASSFAEFFGKEELANVIRWFALILPLASGLKVASSATRISQVMRFSVLAEEIVQPASNLVLIAILFLEGMSLHGAIWATSISFGIGFIVAIYYVLRIFNLRHASLSLDALMSKRLILASAPIGAAAIFTTLMLFVDRIFVGYYLSEAETGVYQAVSLFAVFFVTVLSAVKFIAAPLISSAYHDRDAAKMKQIYVLTTRWGLYLTIPVAGVFIFAPAQSLDVVFGKEFSNGSIALVWLTVSQIANVLSGPVEHFLIMTGHADRWVKITAGTLLLNLLMNWVLIPEFGILGAALSSTVAFAAMSLFAMLYVQRLVGIMPFSLGYLKVVLASVVMSLGLFILLPVGDSTPWMVLGLGTVSALTFFGALWLLGFETEEMDLARLIISRTSRHMG